MIKQGIENAPNLQQSTLQIGLLLSFSNLSILKSEDVHIELDIGRRVEGGLGQSVPTSDTL